MSKDAHASDSLGVDSIAEIAENEATLNEQPGVADDAFSTYESRSKAEDVEKGAQTPIIVNWEENDPENPFNWSKRKKWVVTFTATLLTCIAGSTAAIIASGYTEMSKDLHSSEEENALALSLYPLGFAIAPLVLASFSEEFGRRPMYIVFSVLFTLFYIPVAAAKNIQTILVARFLQGCFSSTGATMVGGTMADIWTTAERGFPMALFALTAIFSPGVGPVIAGWVEMSLGWRWIEWIAMIINGVLTIWLIVYGAQETRGTIILARRAERLRKETGDPRYQTPFKKPNMRELIWISVSRPIFLLITEPIVISFSIWFGFMWGVLFGIVQSMGLVFQTLYGFNDGQVGSVYATLAIGSAIGFGLNFYQEKLYRENFATRGPEARLYAACTSGITFVIGAFIYAWTSYPHVHWIGPCIGITIIGGSIFAVYLTAFNYLADSYLIYASSALAALSFLRNVAAAAFPLFTNQMYNKLDFRWASTLLALIALVLVPVPFVLFFGGPKIRARSRFAKKLLASGEGK